MIKKNIEKFTWEKKNKITRNHIVQSVIVGIYILLVFGAMHSFDSELSIASLGASAFIAFSSPLSETSRPRFFIGGYCVGIICGLFCRFIMISLLPTDVIACALAVIFSMILMIALDLKHPPSSALAVAVVTSDKPVLLSCAALICIAALCGLKQLLKKYLHDL